MVEKIFSMFISILSFKSLVCVCVSTCSSLLCRLLFVSQRELTWSGAWGGSRGGFFGVLSQSQSQAGLRSLSHSCRVFSGIYPFPGDSDGKESICNVGNQGSIPGLGRSPGGGHGNPLQYSCLENLGDGGAWWAAVYGVTQSRTRLKRLSSSSSIVITYI